MGAGASRFLGGIFSASLVVTSVAPAAAALANGRTAAVAASAPAIAAQPAAAATPPANETAEQRKARERAEAHALKGAEHAAREREKAAHPEDHKKRNKMLGCVAGAALGIVGALLLRGRNHHGAGDVVLGAAAGCAAGWALGGALKGDDPQKLDTFVNEDVALRDGEPVRTWTAPNSGATITIQQTDAGYKPIEAVFNVAAGVAPPQPGVLVEGRAMRATAPLRLRSAPGTSAQIVGSFTPNQIVQVIAQTPDQQWALIGENNIVVGYAAMGFLSANLAIPSQARITFATMQRTPPERARPVRRAHAAPAPPPVVAGPPQVIRMAASSRCKSFVASHGSDRSSQQRCAQPNATAWA